MVDFLHLMALPFLACVILTGIHVYLGLHVIQRGIVFVDLALAQVAALGATVGFLFGYELHSTSNYFISLGFSLLGAATFALTRFRTPVVPQEALIGIAYAVAAAGSILILNFAPEGGEELKALMVGHLLFVDWHEILKIFALYAIIGIMHWFIRKPLLLISRDPDQAFREGRNVRGWDFLFYASFGVVVTSSVEIAGVYLVFSFLIVPSVCAVLLTRGVGKRLAVGWICGILTSVVGIAASYYFDLPTGAAVVVAFGAALLFSASLRLALTQFMRP
jgi:zinc/manganese transport system permease protein